MPGVNPAPCGNRFQQLRSEIDKLDRERAAGLALLNQPQNREIASQAAFLNGLIARRSFSLTRLFMELERIMPPRLHVLSITPSLNKQNQIEIHMLVGGDSREQAVELVKRLEDSPSFRQPDSEPSLLERSAGGDRVQFDIASIYVPPARRERAGAGRSSGKSKRRRQGKQARERQDRRRPASTGKTAPPGPFGRRSRRAKAAGGARR